MSLYITTITIDILGHDVEARIGLMYDYIPASKGLREASTGLQLEPDMDEWVIVNGAKVYSYEADDKGIRASHANDASWLLTLFSADQIENIEHELMELIINER